jgi:hypothetical protein
MDELVRTAIDCGLWVYGRYLRDELIGKSSKVADLAGSATSLTSFLGHYGESPSNDEVYFIRGFVLYIKVVEVDLGWWVQMYRPILSCDAFYRSRRVWLGCTGNAMDYVDLTRTKRFRYIGLPIAEPGFIMVANGWTPVTAPGPVIKEFRNRIRILLHLTGLPLDIVNRIVDHL